MRLSWGVLRDGPAGSHSLDLQSPSPTPFPPFHSPLIGRGPTGNEANEPTLAIAGQCAGFDLCRDQNPPIDAQVLRWGVSDQVAGGARNLMTVHSVTDPIFTAILAAHQRAPLVTVVAITMHVLARYIECLGKAHRPRWPFCDGAS
jgi:hypothetical protein